MADQMNKDQNRNSSNQSMGGQKPERTGSQQDLGNQQQQRNQKGSDEGASKSTTRDIQE